MWRRAVLWLSLLASCMPWGVSRLPGRAPDFRDLAVAPAVPQASLAGAVVLLKLRHDPPEPLDADAGRTTLGWADLDALLTRLGAFALPALPLPLEGMHDRVGLGRWVVLDLPSGIDLEAVATHLRGHPEVEPGTVSFEDAGFLRVAAGSPTEAALLPLGRLRPRASASAPRAFVPAGASAARLGAIPPELASLRASSAWASATGAGIGVAVVGTGVDRNHLSLSGRLRAKLGEPVADDADGNGIPGDVFGINLAHLAVVRGPGGTRLALAAPDDWSDWSGVGEPVAAWGSGTAIASLAAGSGEGGSRLGVAPDAWILPVDVQENLSPGRWVRGRDPRSRELPASAAARAELALRPESEWARALGVAYAVSERVRVVVCGWSSAERPAILRDVLRHAEDNCVVAICAPNAAQPDSGHLAPLAISRAVAAVSNPRNDQSPLPDRRVAPREGIDVSLGLNAGAAALLLSARPDLAPEDLHPILGESPRLDLERALRQARALPRGRCAHRVEPQPVWQGHLSASPSSP